MKYFQDMRKPFDILNIYPNTLGQVHGLNMKNYFFLIVSGSSFTWSVIFMVFQAKTVTEFAESFYVFSIGLFVFVIFAIFFAKKKDIFNLIDEYEWTIQKRMNFFSVLYWNSLFSLSSLSKQMHLYYRSDKNSISRNYIQKNERNIRILAKAV